MSEFSIDVGLRIKKLRTERGLDRRVLAARMGCNVDSIGKWETGRCEPGAYYLRQLADALECTTDYLLGRRKDL